MRSSGWFLLQSQRRSDLRNILLPDTAHVRNPVEVQHAGDGMLQSLFLWFYCLSISDAVLLVFAVSAGYLILRHWFIGTRLWRPLSALLFFGWLAVIAAATLTGRTHSAAPVAPVLTPFHSYRTVLAGGNRELLRSNFMNVILFYPAGLLACELLPQGWSRGNRILLVAVLFALASAGIEFCQYFCGFGQPEADDVIHNTLGALIGALVDTICIHTAHFQE